MLRVRADSGEKKSTKPDAKPTARKTVRKVAAADVAKGARNGAALADDGDDGKETSEAIAEILKLAKELGMTQAEAERYYRLSRLLAGGANDDKKAALRIAREMRYSKNRYDRSLALDTFKWGGAVAMPEVTSMLADEDPSIAEEAFDAWMVAFNELEDDVIRCEVIREAATAFDNESHMDAIMLELTKVDRSLAYDTVAKVLQSADSTGVGKECAKEIYEHMTDSRCDSYAEVVAEATAGGPKKERSNAEADAARLKWTLERGGLMQETGAEAPATETGTAPGAEATAPAGP